jgi:hypothetical protein
MPAGACSPTAADSVPRGLKRLGSPYRSGPHSMGQSAQSGEHRGAARAQQELEQVRVRRRLCGARHGPRRVAVRKPSIMRSALMRGSDDARLPVSIAEFSISFAAFSKPRATASANIGSSIFNSKSTLVRIAESRRFRPEELSTRHYHLHAVCDRHRRRPDDRGLPSRVRRRASRRL